MQRLVLGAELGQCCGGVVEVWMERYTRADAALLRAASGAARAGAAVLTSTITPQGVERQIVSALRLGRRRPISCCERRARGRCRA